VSLSLATLLLANLALIGALPRVFFRGGELNLAWWLTALPFFASALLVLGGATGLVQPLVVPAPLPAALAAVAATLLSAGSIALIALTCGTHQRPISLWHQTEDGPASIVTAGPYAVVRHPFYAAFLLALMAVVLALPHLASATLLLYAGVALNLTAAREERRLCTSVFGEEYRAYLERTARFRPRLRGLLR